MILFRLIRSAAEASHDGSANRRKWTRRVGSPICPEGNYGRGDGATGGVLVTAELVSLPE